MFQFIYSLLLAVEPLLIPAERFCPVGVQILLCLFSTSRNLQDHHCDLYELPILKPTAVNYVVCYCPTLTQYHHKLHCVEVCSIFDAVEGMAQTHRFQDKFARYFTFRHLARP